MLHTLFPGLKRFLVAPTEKDTFNLSYCDALKLSLTRGEAHYQFAKRKLQLQPGIVV